MLAPAKALVNDHSIQRVEGGEVEYFHVMFDQHEIVFSEGVPSERFYPGADVLDDVEQATRGEILAIFPELAAMPDSYGPAARMPLSDTEIALLLA